MTQENTALLEALTIVVMNEARDKGADSPVDYGDAEQIAKAVIFAWPSPTTDSLTADAAAVREAAAKVAERDVDWTTFSKRGLEQWDSGPDAGRDYRLGIRIGTVIAAAIRALPLPTQTVPADVAALDGIRHSIIRQLGDDPHADRIILNRTDWDLVLSALSSAALAQPKGGDQE